VDDCKPLPRRNTVRSGWLGAASCSVWIWMCARVCCCRKRMFSPPPGAHKRVTFIRVT
jgi:hypothetical protein